MTVFIKRNRWRSHGGDPIVKGNLHKYPGKKWLKHESLWSEPDLRSVLPETKLFSPQSFTQMIERHDVLFLKPDLGMQGQGIVKVKRGKEGACIVRTASNQARYRDADVAARKLKQRIGSKAYIVQQGIDLLRIQGRPVDFRVLLHLKPNGEWTFFGIMGKIAAKNSFITNYSSGGKAISLHQALSQTLGIEKQDASGWEERIKTKSLRIAQAMKHHYPNITELGLDIAIDTNQQIWLLEANTKPQFQLFRYHSDPQLFQKIAASVRSTRTATVSREKS